MKVHFGLMENYGDYESPVIGCEKTLCGYDVVNYSDMDLIL